MVDLRADVLAQIEEELPVTLVGDLVDLSQTLIFITEALAVRYLFDVGDWVAQVMTIRWIVAVVPDGQRREAAGHYVVSGPSQLDACRHEGGSRHRWSIGTSVGVRASGWRSSSRWCSATAVAAHQHQPGIDLRAAPRPSDADSRSFNCDGWRSGTDIELSGSANVISVNLDPRAQQLCSYW